MRSRFLWMILLTAFLVPAGCSLLRGYEAMLVLMDLAAGEGPSRLKRMTPAPQRQRIDVETLDRRYWADLYQPIGEARCGLLLIPGAAEKGIDDPRLVALATTLARARFVVLVPEFTGGREGKAGPGNIGEVRDVFAWLVSRPDLTPGGRAGMAAFSFGAGPAILAALDAAIRADVSFILAVGGYHDLTEVVTFFTTGYFRKDGRWCRLEPNTYGKWVFVRSNVDRLSRPEDRRLLVRMAERRMADPEASLSDLEPGLSSEGKSVHALVTNRDPERVATLMERLPTGIQEDIAALDLSHRDLSRLQARLLLVHGVDDDIIPYTQSVSLAKGADAEKVHLFLVRGLMHVDIESGLIGRWRLWRAVDTLLGQRG